MKKPLIIGEKTYKYKKDVLLYYKNILNSYKIGQSLNDNDFNDLIDLLNCSKFFSSYEEENDVKIKAVSGQEILAQGIVSENPIIDLFSSPKEYTEEEIQQAYQAREDELSELKAEIIDNYDKNTEQELEIIDIKVSKVQFGSKCFEVFYNDATSQYISYIMIINNPSDSPESLFNKACRNAIQKDIVDIKKKYFYDNAVKGFVKCQETGQLSKWEELAVDHRQPNTFSVIVDRFKEVNKIDLANIEYVTNEINSILFANEILIEEFRSYHKEKANLRIVRKERNLSRTGMARLKRTSKDLTIK